MRSWAGCLGRCGCWAPQGGTPEAEVGPGAKTGLRHPAGGQSSGRCPGGGVPSWLRPLWEALSCVCPYRGSQRGRHVGGLSPLTQGPHLTPQSPSHDPSHRGGAARTRDGSRTPPEPEDCPTARGPPAEAAPASGALGGEGVSTETPAGALEPAGVLTGVQGQVPPVQGELLAPGPPPPAGNQALLWMG